MSPVYEPAWPLTLPSSLATKRMAVCRVKGVCAPGRDLPGCPQSGSRPSRKEPPLAPRPTPLAALGTRLGGGLERRPEAQQLQLHSALCLLSPRGEKFLRMGSSLVLSRWPKLQLQMLLPTPTSGPEARCVLSPPAQRRRLGSVACTPPPPRKANQRWVPRPGPAPAPPRSREPRQSAATRARARGAGAAGEEGCPEASATRTVTGRPYGTGLGG